MSDGVPFPRRCESSVAACRYGLPLRLRQRSTSTRNVGSIFARQDGMAAGAVRWTCALIVIVIAIGVFLVGVGGPRCCAHGAAGSRLEGLLVAGDSLATTLDQDLAQRLIADGIPVYTDNVPASNLSQNPYWSEFSWRNEAEKDAKQYPGASVVMFVGANEGYTIDRVMCCGAPWVSKYAARVQKIMTIYLNMDNRVYWLTSPEPPPARRTTHGGGNNRDRHAIASAVNTAVGIAANAVGSRVRVIDTVKLLGPTYNYRKSIPIEERVTPVRAYDLEHINDAGSNLVASCVFAYLQEDFGLASAGTPPARDCPVT